MATTELFRHRYDGVERSWTAVYATTWDGPVVPQADEVAWHAWESVDEVARRAAAATFVPDGRELFERWLAEGGRRPPPGR